MARELSKAFVDEFDAAVHIIYQEEGGQLRSTVMNRTGVVGKSKSFNKYGSGSARPRGAPSSDVTPMGVEAGLVPAILTDWVAPEYSDIFDQAKINFDDLTQLQRVVAYAMGRRENQIIIDSIVDAKPTKTIAADFHGVNDPTTGDVGLTPSKVRRAKKLLDDDGVPNDGRRHMVVTTGAIEEMLAFSEVTSKDYNQIQRLADGEIDSWLGFKWHMIADFTSKDGDTLGLPGIGTLDRKYFAYHEDSIGIAVGIDHRTEINYVATKTSYLVNGIFSAGAVVVDALGVVEINGKETA